MKEAIGVFDSGLGGLSVLSELIKLMPNENYIFYEDSINNPYGEKDEDELVNITSNIVDYLLKNNCKIIVIACNTATTCCMKRLRELYPNVIFVGTVPAVKVAFDNHYKHTIVLSTPYTTKSRRVIELIHDYHNTDQEIINLSGENLANLIELNKKEEIRALLEKILGPYRGKVDSIVLGCTHYSLIKEDFSEILPGIPLLDGCVGVSMEVKRQLEKNNLLTTSCEKGYLKIVNSKSDDYIKKSYDILDL